MRKTRCIGDCDASLLLFVFAEELFVVERPREDAGASCDFPLDIANSANRGDRRTGVFSIDLGVFTLETSRTTSLTIARRGAPNRRGVRPAVRPAVSRGDARSTSPFTPRFSGSRINLHSASVIRTSPSGESAPMERRCPRPGGVASARGPRPSKYSPNFSSSASGFAAEKSKYLGAVNSHLRERTSGRQRARARGVHASVARVLNLSSARASVSSRAAALARVDARMLASAPLIFVLARHRSDARAGRRVRRGRRSGRLGRGRARRTRDEREGSVRRPSRASGREIR